MLPQFPRADRSGSSYLFFLSAQNVIHHFDELLLLLDTLARQTFSLVDEIVVLVLMNCGLSDTACNHEQRSLRDCM